MILGLAGKSGSGKNCIADYLETKGFAHFDLDLWAHKGLSENKEILFHQFGNAILDGENNIDRKALGQMVFSSAEKRQKLQGILYPWLEKIIVKEMEQHKNAVLNGALLSESSLQNLCDGVLWVKAPLLRRLLRLKKRDHRGFFHLWKRLYSQRFLSPQLFLSEVDIHIVRNHRSLESCYRQIDVILENFSKKG